ncbi:MAG: LLM class flavin-dependent oxidoreductase [Candidatus Dormibacteraeota bacterium]|nr:LLM class flavin-dependent oxidoreductase [Candidatus Dormibacteraeota bacterium]
MKQARFGIGLRGDRQASEYRHLSHLAENLGFDVVTVFADLGYEPPLRPLLEAAAATRHVSLGAACLNPFTMHPLEIAGQVAALDLASNGRAYLGLARGAWLDSIGVSQRRPLRAIRETAEVVRKLLAGDIGGYRGEIFTLEPGFRLRQTLVRDSVPLLIGGWGERTVELAGEIAGELKVGGSSNARLVPLMLSRLAKGAARAGRDRGLTGVVIGAVTVVDDDGAAARDRARSAVAMYFEVVARLDPTVDVPEGLVEQVGRLLREGHDQAAGRLIPDELLDRFAFAGTPKQVARQVRDVFDAGASRVEFGTPFGLDAARGLGLLGERVLPAFR